MTQMSGLAETCDHTVECIRKDAGAALAEDERFARKARTGVSQVMMEHVSVLNEDSIGQVPMDGATVGEVMLRGNVMMKGYLKNPDATGQALRGGSFHSGDVAYQHPTGDIKITDRSKGIIIPGGENVPPVEVESAPMHHPAVLLCAVVAKPDAA